MDYDKLAKAIYDITGPAANIEKAYNCMTRLRLTVKDEHFTKEDLAKLPGVMGINKSGDEWQIVVGPGKATKLYQAFAPLVEGGSKENPAPSARPDSNDDSQGPFDSQALHEEIRRKNATPAKLALKKIAHIFVPIIPAFIACGLITGLLNVAFKMDPSLAAQPLMQVLAIAGNAAFYGLNIFVGINAAKEFGGSPMLGGVMAAILSHPNLAQINLFGDSLVPGRGGIIAVLLVVFFSSWLEKKLHRIVPDMLDLFVTPFLVVVISTFVALFLCQPVGGYLSEAIGYAATESIGTGGAVTGFILGGTFLPMVMVGIHQGLTPILAMAGGGQVGAAIAVYAKTKNKALRKTIASALPVGLMGVGEPLIYGVTLPLGKPFIGACIGGAFGGAVQAAYMVGAATIGISGLPLAASTDNIPMYLLGLVTAYAAGFIATWLLGFDDPKEGE